MAACTLGASGLAIPSLNLVSARCKFSTRQPFHGFQIRIPEYSPWDGLQMPVRPKRAYLGCQFSASEVTANLDDPPKESNDSRIPSRVSKFIPKSTEVEALVTEICDTSIAEFELKLGGFQLYLMRGLNQQVASVPTPVTAPVSVDTATEVPNASGSASSTSLAITKLGSSSRSLESLLAKALDEGLVILQSPKVGYFRSSRTIKGKRAPPSCKEKQQVNEGQVLCYIEQLGGEIPIESDISGEVIKILREDGEPVGYGDALIAMLPEFPGIKKL